MFLHAFNTSPCVNLCLCNSETPVFHFLPPSFSSNFFWSWQFAVALKISGILQTFLVNHCILSVIPFWMENPVKCFCRLLTTANYCSGANRPDLCIWVDSCSSALFIFFGDCFVARWLCISLWRFQKHKSLWANCQ